MNFSAFYQAIVNTYVLILRSLLPKSREIGSLANLNRNNIVIKVAVAGTINYFDVACSKKSMANK